jgi:hypothetical protein
LEYLPYRVSPFEIKSQTAGKQFEQITKAFLEQSFVHLQQLHPGQWRFSIHDSITQFDQYRHLSALSRIIETNKDLKTAFGDYVIAPDIVVGRHPVTDAEINQHQSVVDEDNLPRYTPLRAANNSALLLHASISCKWTLRSDRSQNARTEGLNLIRNRKGHTPHIVVVTGEPVPSRIASLALGTGDIDCVYHFALHELIQAVRAADSALDAIEMLEIMIEGRRLRDIGDLPFDLAV